MARFTHPPSRPFITSSTGLGFDKTCPGEIVTLLDEDSVIYLPLSAAITLEITTPFKTKELRQLDVDHVVATEFESRNICSVVAFCADQFVIANNPDFNFPKFGAKGV
jgi:hypothetical protein